MALDQIKTKPVISTARQLGEWLKGEFGGEKGLEKTLGRAPHCEIFPLDLCVLLGINAKRGPSITLPHAEPKTITIRELLESVIVNKTAELILHGDRRLFYFDGGIAYEVPHDSPWYDVIRAAHDWCKQHLP
ncbi:MAG: hypothetical protein NTZ65_04955 [Candidatus Berkelbacteria bacterium]|nr:hypothetical protein [Candidatus Berkelbacteria bacterium]